MPDYMNEKELIELGRRVGAITPKNEGLFTEFGQGSQKAFLDVMEGTGRTAEELGMGSGMREYFEEAQAVRRHLNPDPNYTAMSLNPGNLGRTLGSGLTQSTMAAAGGLAATALTGNPAIGTAVMTGTMFAQTYGDTVKEYREAMPDQPEGTIKGLAFFSAAGQSLIESYIGPEQAANLMIKGLVTNSLKETTKGLVRRVGAEAAKGFISEGAEEVAQDFWNRLTLSLGTKNLDLPKWEDVRENFFGGAIPGAVMGGATGIPSGNSRMMKDERGKMKEGPLAAAPLAGKTDIEGQPVEPKMYTPEELTGEQQTVGELLLDELGVKHRRMTAEEQGTEGIGFVTGEDGVRRFTNGLYDKNTKEILINPENDGELFSHGHELKHWMDANAKDLSAAVDAVMDEQFNESGLAEGKDVSADEFKADMFGKILEDPEALRDMANRLESKQRSFGERFIRAVIDYCNKVMAFAKKNVTAAGAEQYFNDYKAVRNKAVEVLAELRGRNSAVMKDERGKMKEGPLAAAPLAGKDRTRGVVNTPNNEMKNVPFRYEVLPLGDLISSDDTRFDQRLQNRNRDTKASLQQISKIATNPDPKQLLESAISNTGAPIIDGLNQVLSGNGRTIAMKNMTDAKFKQVQDAVLRFAQENGIAVPKGKRLVLVRRIDDSTLGKRKEDFVRYSNQESVLKMSSAEQAENDAAVIEDKNLAKNLIPNEDGNLFSRDNRDFVRDFVNATGAENLITSEGDYTPELEMRIQRALLGVFAMKTKDGRNLLKNLIEKQSTLGLNKVVKGVMTSAGNVIQIARKKPKYDLRKDIGQALELYVQYKQYLKDNNTGTVETFESQPDFPFGEGFEKEAVSPAGRKLFHFFANTNTIKGVYEYLNGYCLLADKQELNTPDMFGAKPLTKMEVLDKADPSALSEMKDERGKMKEEPLAAAPLAGKEELASRAPEKVEQKANDGRFNIDSETPLLTPEEDASDFQLVGETAAEEKARDREAEEVAKAETERKQKEMEAGTAELFPEMRDERGEMRGGLLAAAPLAEEEKQDADTIIRKTSPGSAERVNVFMKLPDGEHTIDGKKFIKNGFQFERDGQKLSARGIERSFQDVPKGEVVKKDLTSGKIEDYGEKIEGARKDIAVKTGKRGARNTAELDGENVPAWRKKYFAMDDRDGKWDLYVEDKSRIGNCRRETYQYFKSEAEALKHIPEAYLAEHYYFGEGEKGFSVYRRNKSSRKLTNLKDGFQSKEEAMKWALEHVDELSGMRNSKGEGDLLTKPDYERTGERRMNRNVTAEDFGKTFGFRGVQFGLWENQEERQQVLNDAYEALYDLADLLKIPPKAISLNGELGAAFGARGHGGKARAHYEPGEVVINLTKPKGAGTFAHEWFHALDNYFKKQSMGYDGKSVNDYLSESTVNKKYQEKEIHHSNGETVTYDQGQPGPGGMREELFNKFEALKKAIKDSERPHTAEEIQKTKLLIEKKREDVRQRLADLKDKLEHASEKVPSRRKIKDATSEQLKAFDEIAKKIMSEDAAAVDWKGIENKNARYGATYRYTNDGFEELNNLYKNITGYSGYDSKYADTGDVGRIAYAMHFADKLKAGMTQTVREGTRFYQDARKLDNDRSGTYWSTDVEMFARAFSAFVEDKLKSEGRKSEYLSYGSSNDLYDWGVESPFPGGEERERINKAFQSFFDEMKHETDEKGNVRLYSLRSSGMRDIERINTVFNDEIDRQISGEMEPGYVYQLGRPSPILLNTGIPNLPIELSSSRLSEKANNERHPFDLKDVKDLPFMLQDPIGIFAYGDKNKAQNILIEVQKNGKNFIVGLSLNYDRNGLMINSIRGLFPKDTHEWLTWIQNGKSLYLDKEKIQKLINQQRMNFADVEYLDLDLINNIIQNFKNTTGEERNFEENDGSRFQYSLRKKAEPEKKLTGYKVFALKKNRPGELFPPMVANPGGASTPAGVWLDADAAPRAADSKTGRMQVQAGGEGTNTGKQTLAYRPGWHLGPVPDAKQFLVKNPETGELRSMFPENFVFAECEFAADKNYQEEAMSYGYNEDGKFQHSLAGLPKIPEDGYYTYRTNPRPDTVPWYITGAMKINRILTDEETAKILKSHGIEMTPRRGGPIDLKAWGLDDKQYSLRKQVNPIVADPEIQKEYQEELNSREYAPEKVAQWDKQAVQWILKMGGIRGAVEAILNHTEHNDRHVATLARKHIMNSDVFKTLPAKTRADIEMEHVFSGTAWGREGVARRLASLTLDSVEKVQALFNKLNEKLPDSERIKLRKEILEKYGVDILNVPDNIVGNKDLLDALLREEQTKMSTLGDKLYEYWINAILSGPATHAANIFGNTGNALYELGAKRFAEAAVNLLARRADAATFGEFKEMWRALNTKEAWKRAMEAFKLEAISPAGKLQENNGAAIGGKFGRIVRTPGRLLRAADEFSRALLVPIEGAALAYREGKSKGITGKDLQKYIQQRMADANSDVMRRAQANAARIIFQEKPGKLTEYLIGLKNEGGFAGTILKYVLPFIKTPGNILKQGVRKSPLGALNLAYETGEVLAGKRSIDSEYLGHVAEQILAWGALMAIGAFDDDDDEPWITGSSSAYGSAKQKFNQNALPPYSIKIGDTWYSYKRIEPLATALAMMADAKQGIRDARNGKEVSSILSDYVNRTGKMISEKSYLDSINQVYQFMQDPDRSVTRFGTNFLASWVPNVYKQASIASDDYERESKNMDGAEGFLWQITNRAGLTRAVPKVDLWGNEITKEEAEKAGSFGDIIWRLFIPVQRRSEIEDPGSRFIQNWNIQHPNEEWWPSIPQWKFSMNKERYHFGNEDYHDFAVESGQLAAKQVRYAIRHGLINPDNPTAEQVELMKKIFSRARKETRARFAPLMMRDER